MHYNMDMHICDECDVLDEHMMPCCVQCLDDEHDWCSMPTALEFCNICLLSICYMMPCNFLFLEIRHEMARWRVGSVPCLDECWIMIVDEMMICLFRWILGHDEIHTSTSIMMWRVDMSINVIWYAGPTQQ